MSKRNWTSLSRNSELPTRRVLMWLCYASLVVGCAQTKHSLPVGTQILRDRLVVNSDVDVDLQERLLPELVALRASMADQLCLLDSIQPIYVYLFADETKFVAYSRKTYPQLKGRRAFFVENAAGLNVYARWGDRVVEDLRHELAHGYLHAVAPQVPLWLDEGIAEYYEVPAEDAGLNWPHIEQLIEARQNSHWEPDLARLEQLVDPGSMNQKDYAESWLWVHCCLNTKAERADALRRYLAALQTREPPSAFADENVPTNEELLAHLRFLMGQ